LNKLQEIKNYWDPREWTYKHYFFVAIFLLALNILGTRGLVHIHYLKQEISLTEQRIQEERIRIANKEEALQRLKTSTTLKERLLREYLAYLKDDEWSLEFYNPKVSAKKSAPISQPSLR
jgi:hypothetical protein